MKKEYDFSKGERGKFYKKGIQLRLPIYLDLKLQRKLELIAQDRRQQLTDIVNKFLRNEIRLVR